MSESSPFGYPSDTLRIPFGCPSDALRMPCGRHADWLTGAWPSPPNCPDASQQPPAKPQTRKGGWLNAIRPRAFAGRLNSYTDPAPHERTLPPHPDLWGVNSPKHPTPNTQHRTSKDTCLRHYWMLGVRCWMFDVSGRVGVRENGPYSNLTSQTLAGTGNVLHGKASDVWEPAPLINTQPQFGVWRTEGRTNRFTGFALPHAGEDSREAWPPWSRTPGE